MLTQSVSELVLTVMPLSSFVILSSVSKNSCVVFLISCWRRRHHERRVQEAQSDIGQDWTWVPHRLRG